MRLKGNNAEFTNKKFNSYTAPVAIGLKGVKSTVYVYCHTVLKRTLAKELRICRNSHAQRHKEAPGLALSESNHSYLLDRLQVPPSDIMRVGASLTAESCQNISSAQCTVLIHRQQLFKATSATRPVSSVKTVTGDEMDNQNILGTNMILQPQRLWLTQTIL